MAAIRRWVPALILCVAFAGSDLARSWGDEKNGPIYKGKRLDGWVAALKDKDPKVRLEAASALARIGEPAQAPLAELLTDTDPTTRSEAALVLGRMGPKASRAAISLLKATTDRAVPVRISAASALAKVSPDHVKDAVTALGVIARDRESDHRVAAAKALGEIGKEAKSVAIHVADVVVFSTGADREAAVAALKNIDEKMVAAALERAKQRDEVWGKVLAKEPPAAEKTPKETGNVETTSRGGKKADEKSAIAAVEKLGGVVRFDRDDPKKAVSVGLQGVKLADADLERLAALPSLQTLVLKRATFSGSALKAVAKLKALEFLDLMDTSISGDDLKHLDGLVKVKTLDLGLNPKLTDAGLKHLKKLKDLETLNLSASKVSDEGLKELERHKKLKFLNLSGTKVTKKGVERLELALPGVGVISTARE